MFSLLMPFSRPGKKLSEYRFPVPRSGQKQIAFQAHAFLNQGEKKHIISATICDATPRSKKHAFLANAFCKNGETRETFQQRFSSSACAYHWTAAATSKNVQRGAWRRVACEASRMQECRFNLVVPATAFRVTAAVGLRLGWLS